MKTRLLSIFTLLFTIVSFSQTFTFGNLNYEIIDLGLQTVRVIGGSNLPRDLIIPETVVDTSNTGLVYNVTIVGRDAFKDEGIESVVIPNTIIEIENSAFFRNNLTELNIPNSVTKLGKKCFERNKLTTVIIPSSITIIESGAFALNDLTDVVIPDSVTRINFVAFVNNKLTSVRIPSSVNFIGAQAFLGNPLNQIISEGEQPANIVTTGTGDSFGADRSGIDLFIPENTTQVYLDNGWIGFASITEGDPTLSTPDFGQLGKLTLYPNPAQNVVNIELPQGISANRIMIYDLRGRLIRSLQNNESKNVLNIDISNLEHGSYFIKVETPQGRATQQIIKN